MGDNKIISFQSSYAFKVYNITSKYIVMLEIYIVCLRETTKKLCKKHTHTQEKGIKIEW